MSYRFAPLAPLALAATLALALSAHAQDAAAPSAAPAPGAYAIDPVHSTIGFAVTHLAISEVEGRFNEINGTLVLGDKERGTSFTATIPVASVDTGNTKRDDHLRSDDFFKATTHPTIEFRSTSVDVQGDAYAVTGDFTMHGQTKEVTIPFRYTGSAEMRGQQRVGFTGDLNIDRREWGLDAWQGMVGNEIRIRLSFQGIKE